MCSVADGLLVMMGDSGIDYVAVYLNGGRVSVLFNRNTGFNAALKLTSSSIYNDALIHQVTVVFDDRTIKMVIDGAERDSQLSMCL